MKTPDRGAVASVWSFAGDSQLAMWDAELVCTGVLIGRSEGNRNPMIELGFWLWVLDPDGKTWMSGLGYGFWTLVFWNGLILFLDRERDVFGWIKGTAGLL